MHRLVHNKAMSALAGRHCAAKPEEARRSAGPRPTRDTYPTDGHRTPRQTPGLMA